MPKRSNHRQRSTSGAILTRISPPSVFLTDELARLNSELFLMPSVLDRRLTGTARRVLVVLVHHLDHDDGIAYVSQDQIAELLDMQRPNVSRAVRQLVTCGYVQLGYRDRGRTYCLLPQAPIDLGGSL